MTNKKPPLSTEAKKNTSTQAPAPKTATPAPKKVPTKEVKEAEDKDKVSKLAIVAIIIALGSTAAHYFWQQQQSQLQTAQLSMQIETKNSATSNQYQAQMQQALNTQQQTFTSQLQQISDLVNDTNAAKIIELKEMVEELERKVKQRQPGDWLLHEAEYLVRVAARTLLLEHDTTAAIGLLKNADARLADLNDPTFLPARKLVHEDIKSLELMPVLQTDEIVLTLMAMNNQIAMLPLAMVEVGTETNINQELSSDINDWQANLSKTWQKFLDDFIRVRQRTGMIEPLVSPKQQQNLKQNLKLKIQLALWAASERKGDIYQKSLVDIKQWFTEFFDIEEVNNQRFLQAITGLQKQRVSYEYPNELASLTAIRIALKNYEAAAPIPLPVEPQVSPSEAEAAENTPTIKQADTVKPESESEQSSPALEEDEQPKAENEEDII
jgi:uroporphyrin-3 C-methyltransferase